MRLCKHSPTEYVTVLAVTNCTFSAPDPWLPSKFPVPMTFWLGRLPRPPSTWQIHSILGMPTCRDPRMGVIGQGLCPPASQLNGTLALHHPLTTCVFSLVICRKCVTVPSSPEVIGCQRIVSGFTCRIGKGAIVSMGNKSSCRFPLEENPPPPPPCK